MNYRNAKFTAQPNVIDCEIEHPKFGWIPFTADPNDVEPLGAKVFNAAKASATKYVEPPVDPKALATVARTKRNALLTESDWTQVADAPVDQAAWATYRQALRDITDQAGFPENIDWPVAPE